MKKKQRNSNIELLRIVLMLMIIGVHYNLIGMGNAFLYTRETGINVSLTNLLEAFCVVCVDTFIIITGYFQIKKKRINYSKVPRFIIIILFFNFIQYMLNVIINNIQFNITDLIKQTLSGKWFIVIYLVLYLLSPYINKLVENLKIKDFKKLLLLLIIIFIIYQTVLSYLSIVISPVGWSGIIDQGIDKGYTIVNFIVLYLIGGYIKITGFNINLKKAIFLYLISIFFVFLSWYILEHTGHSSNATISYYYNNVFVVLSSVSIFLIFNNINIKNNKVINFISKHNMIIFVLSTSPLFLSLYSILRTPKYSITKYLIPHFIITCIIIYVSCLLVGIIGLFILEKTVFKLIEK